MSWTFTQPYPMEPHEITDPLGQWHLGKLFWNGYPVGAVDEKGNLYVARGNPAIIDVPYTTQWKTPNKVTAEALAESLEGKGVHGTYATADEAFANLFDTDEKASKVLKSDWYSPADAASWYEEDTLPPNLLGDDSV